MAAAEAASGCRVGADEADIILRQVRSRGAAAAARREAGVRRARKARVELAEEKIGPSITGARRSRRVEDRAPLRTVEQNRQVVRRPASRCDFQFVDVSKWLGC